MEKEEKDFRKKFKFEGMIQVLYQVSVIPVLTCKKWGNKDLPLQPGETIDVIVKPVDDKLIGRNQEGKCKLPRPQHSIF
uniref:Helically-extended SH3 domain-containing protein n=1 Tax=Scleropages formosus TaxID=113540 RepID=A0A8C9S5N8_SCLFO